MDKDGYGKYTTDNLIINTNHAVPINSATYFPIFCYNNIKINMFDLNQNSIIHNYILYILHA